MMIAFETGVMSIGAGMMIFAPFVPNLAANMYVVNIGSMSIAAGMRIGRVTTSFVNRELYAEPYYGQD
jgi:prolipoprotein diacylglyceryltransferase